LLDFLHAISDSERAQILGGALYYQDEPTGQYVRLRVWKGGFLTVAWARPDYTNAQWERFQGQPVNLVFEPFQRLNGAVSFTGNPNAADDFRRLSDGFWNLRQILAARAGQEWCERQNKKSELNRKYPAPVAAKNSRGLHFYFPNSASRIPGMGWWFCLSQ